MGKNRRNDIEGFSSSENGIGMKDIGEERMYLINGRDEMWIVPMLLLYWARYRARREGETESKQSNDT